jgi:hypothetical protein
VERARERGWQYEKIAGDMALVTALVNGAWDERAFLVVEPGHRVTARYDDNIVGTEPAQ